MFKRKLIQSRPLIGALLCAGALVSMPAMAASVGPNGPFTASGPTNLTSPAGGGPCTSTFSGTVTNGVLTIDGPSSSFVGSSPICGLLVGVGTWTASVVSPTELDLHNVHLRAPAARVSCGPGTVRGTLSGGKFSFNATIMPGNCQVQGELDTTPALSISWP